MKSDWDVKFTLVCGFITFFAILIFKEQISAKEIYSAVSLAVSIVATGRWLGVTYLWKRIPLLRKIHNVPNLEGEWKGQYKSTWSASPGALPPTGNVRVKIIQPNIFKIKITQETDESISFSTSEGFEVMEDGTIYLNFSYRNEPKAGVRAQSPISYGSARYRLDEATSLRLHGDYFTDRKTTGEIDISK